MDCENLIRITSAGISAVCAQTIVQPIETVKVRIQNDQNNIYKSTLKTIKLICCDEHIKNLWNGMIPSIIRELTYSSLRFGLYVPIKTLINKKTNLPNDNFGIKLISGGISGGISAFISNPFDLLKCRAQATIGNTNIIKSIKNISKYGLIAFWKGGTATVNRAILLNSVKLSTYDEIKYNVAKFGNLNPSDKKCVIISSFITGFVVTCVIAPIDFARTRFMCSNLDNHSKKYKSISDVFRIEPVNKWFRGFCPQWGRYGPYAIVHFYVWELICKWCGILAI